MKKKVRARKLGRSEGARRALFRSLMRALVEHNSIKTTKAKAKAFQGDIDKLINIAKGGDLSDRRRVSSVLGNDERTAKKIFDHIAPKLKKRKGGYTKMINLPTRRGDRAKMVRFTWVEEVTKTIKSGKSDKNTKGKKKDESKLKSVAKKVVGKKSKGTKNKKKAKPKKSNKGKNKK